MSQSQPTPPLHAQPQAKTLGCSGGRRRALNRRKTWSFKLDLTKFKYLNMRRKTWIQKSLRNGKSFSEHI